MLLAHPEGNEFCILQPRNSLLDERSAATWLLPAAVLISPSRCRCCPATASQSRIRVLALERLQHR